MQKRSSRPAAVILLALWTLSPALVAAPRDHRSDWLGSEMPLQLPVRSQQDLTFKTSTERQYLIFNLMAAGKVAWDAGDFAGAAEKWETLLQMPAIPLEIDKVVRPLAIDARSRAGKPGAVLPPPPAAAPAPEVAREASPAPTPPRPRRGGVTVEGTVSGGGAAGPGGAVITLHRAEGPTPRPAPLKDRVIVQRDKMFLPHVLAIPLGSTVVFRNAEEAKLIFHQVFSPGPADRFDTGIYPAGVEKSQEFDEPGVVQLLCNIHAKMSGFIDVVDTPWFAQADAAGNFKISGVPPGNYEVEVWHEFASKTTHQTITVGREGGKLALVVGGDRWVDPNPVDIKGKARQEQLGY